PSPTSPPGPGAPEHTLLGSDTPAQQKDTNLVKHSTLLRDSTLVGEADAGLTLLGGEQAKQDLTFARDSTLLCEVSDGTMLGAGHEATFFGANHANPEIAGLAVPPAPRIPSG